MRSPLLLLAMLAMLAMLPVLPAQGLERAWSVQPGFAVAIEHLADVDGDDHPELLLFGVAGEVRIFAPKTGALRGNLKLPAPDRSLVSLARLDAGKALSLVVASPGGVHSFALRDGVFAAPAKRLLRRGRFTLRTGRPQLSNIVQDVNGDGHPDLVVPGRSDCSLYLSTPAPIGNGGDTGQGRQFELASRLALRVTASSGTGGQALSSQLECEISIPDLRTEDVNGDQRLDLVAEEDQRRTFHLQRDGGRYPVEPDVVLDLSIFRDTTPKASIQLGQTLALDRAFLSTRDLSADGIPDYVIAHRRKVWVFHGTKAGPQFEKPSAILKMAEEVSFVVTMSLDEDAYPDLLMFRLELPSVATLIKGWLFQWDVEIEAIGYRNEAGRTFAKKPAWKSSTTLRVPAISGLVNKPEAIVERFRNASGKFRHALVADLDADGTPDALMQGEDRKQLEFWLAAGAVDRTQKAREQEMRAYLFEDENRVWDVERVLRFMQDKAASRFSRITRGKPATGTFALRDPARYRLDFAATADLDGDGSQEVVLRYVDLEAPAVSTFDILRLRP